MSDWRTWLLVRDLDVSLDNWVRESSLADQFDLSARPRLSIRREGDAVVLRTPDLRLLFAYLQRAPKATLYGFATAPAADLPFLHGKEFFYMSVVYRLLRLDGAPSQRRPYENRLFRVEKAGTSVQRDDQTGQAEIKEGPVDEAAAMFLDPLPIELTGHGADGLLQGLQPGQPYSAITGGCFLPPFRDRMHPEVATSYFGSEPLQLRHAFRDSADLRVARGDEPVLVHLTRLADDPVLRDVLLDGASLRVARAEGEPTAIHLHVPQAEQPCAVARRGVVLHGTMAGPEWARHVAAALRDDVASIVDAVVATDAEPRCSWQLDVEQSNNPTAREGTWQHLFHEVAPLINIKYPSLAKYFTATLLEPASSVHDKTFDHAMAERLLMAYAWRYPWPVTDGELGAWRHALLDLLPKELVRKPWTPEQRLEDWNNESRAITKRGRAFNAGQSRAPRLNIHYMGDPDDNDVLFRRLLLPLGTVLNARTIYLNKGARSQLDAGLVLA